MPHFHIEGPGFRASVAIETLEPIVDNAPVAVLKKAIRWAACNQSELRAKWQELNR